MKEKLIEAKNELLRQMRNISITFNVTVYLLYITYLAYALTADIGIKEVNIALIIGTGFFLIIYLVLKLIGGKAKKGIKATKKFYKRYKLVTKLFSVGTTLYAIITAQGAVSPVANTLAYLSATFLILRIITELITSSIEKSVKKIKDKFKQSSEERREKKRRVNTDDIEITVDECVLSDEEI